LYMEETAPWQCSHSHSETRLDHHKIPVVSTLRQMSHNVATLNINGISLLDNQIPFMDFLYANNIDILLILEVMAYCLDNIPRYVCHSGWYYTYRYWMTPN
jgi:hypothetical protein